MSPVPAAVGKSIKTAADDRLDGSMAKGEDTGIPGAVILVIAVVLGVIYYMQPSPLCFHGIFDGLFGLENWDLISSEMEIRL